MSDYSDDSPADAESGTTEPALRRGWWVVVAVALVTIGVLGAVFSVRMRRTQTARTEAAFGSAVIRALQSSSRFEIALEADPQELTDRSEATDATEAAKAVDVGEIPGVGHLRHAFLDQRHYDWSSRQEQPVDSSAAGVDQPRWATITLSGTPRGFEPIETTQLRVELSSGWVGIPGEEVSVRLNDRVAPAVRKQLTTMSNVRGGPAG